MKSKITITLVLLLAPFVNPSVCGSVPISQVDLITLGEPTYRE
jgi:hypothetical protein